MIKCTSTSASLKFYMFRAISVSCLRFIFLPFQCQMWTEYQMIHFLHFSSLLAFNVSVDFAPPQSHIISVRKCVFTREAAVSGGADVLSEVACLC